MKRSQLPTFGRLVPTGAFFLAATLFTCQLAQPALADLNFKPSYNKVQIAAVEPGAKSAAASPAIVAPPPVWAGKDPFPLSSKFSRRLQKVTGLNWLGAAVASEAATIAVHHKLGGKVKVKVKTYSFTDLLAGKLKSVSVDLKEPKISGIGLGQVKIASANPIWFAYRKDKHGNRGLQTPVLMLVNANLSQKQVARALEKASVSEKLHGLKLDLPGVGEQQLQVVKPTVLIEDDKLKLDATLITRGGSQDSGVPVTIEAKPTLVGDSKIVLDNMKVNSPSIIEPEKFADFTSKLINPVVDFARMDRRDHAFRLDSLKVSGKDGDVEGKGRLLLVPKAKPSGQVAQVGGGIH